MSSQLISVFLCLFFHLVTKMPLPAQEDLSLRYEIEKIILHDTEISHQKVPGFIVGVVDGEKISLSSFGNLYRDSNRVISDTSIFEIGGLTKIFTAQLCHILSKRGELDLTAPVNQYIDRSHQNEYLKDLTIKNLLTHTSGLPTFPSNLGQKQKNPSDPYLNYSKVDLLDYYHSIKRPLATDHYTYSHTNYALLEIVLENATGKAYPTLIDHYICTPNHLDRTFVIDDTHYLAPGYDRTGRETEPWTFPAFAGSEGLKSCAQDLCTYIQRQLSGTNSDEAFQSMLMPFVRIGGSKKSYSADGWHLFKNRKRPNIYLHSGKTAGHAASIHFILETKTAVILLTNGVAKMDGLATLVLRLVNDTWKRNE